MEQIAKMWREIKIIQLNPVAMCPSNSIKTWKVPENSNKIREWIVHGGKSVVKSLRWNLKGESRTHPHFILLHWKLIYDLFKDHSNVPWFWKVESSIGFDLILRIRDLRWFHLI